MCTCYQTISRGKQLVWEQEAKTMPPLRELVTYTVFLDYAAHQLADKFCQFQADGQQAERVYLNTLAVYAVHEYLQEQGIATDLAMGDSWDPVMQTCLDVADLVMPDGGRLECRPVLPDAKVLSIPPETWENRIGYVAVELDGELEEATLLGFVSNVAGEEVPIDELLSLEELPAYLERVKGSRLGREPTHLSQWLQHQVEATWQILEKLVPPPVELAFSFRNASRLGSEGSEAANEGVTRGKTLDLALQQGEDHAVLLVNLQPAEAPEMDISIRLCAVKDQGYLPVDLQMRVLSDRGETMMQAKTEETSECLEFQFSGELGERFSLQVELGEVRLTEEFVI
jgi:hypothetical protein